MRQRRAARGEIDEERFAGALALAGLPDPDLLIRTGGEQRISNFLLWNLAYTELYFSDTLWPDFDAAELDAALRVLRRRASGASARPASSCRARPRSEQAPCCTAANASPRASCSPRAAGDRAAAAADAATVRARRRWCSLGAWEWSAFLARAGSAARAALYVAWSWRCCCWSLWYVTETTRRRAGS